MSMKKNMVLLLKAPTNEDKTDKFEFKNLDLLKEKLYRPDDFYGMILSSPRCVQAVRYAHNNSQLSDEWKQKSNYVVGETTYEVALKELGIKCLGKETGNADNLSVILLNDNTKKLFLYPHGNLKMDILKSKFDGSQLRLDEVEVYETIGNENITAEFNDVTDSLQTLPEYVVFFSPSGVKAMDKLLRHFKESTKFIAIGPTTERAMVEYGLSVFGTAEQPTPSEILKLLL